MNKRTEQTRWTPKRLLSLLMALIMTLSLLPTAAFAFGDGETNTIDASKVATGDTPNHVVDGPIIDEDSTKLWHLEYTIDKNAVANPNEQVTVTALAKLNSGIDSAELTEVSISFGNQTTYNQNKSKSDLSIVGYPVVGIDGSADFTLGLKYTVNEETHTKSVHVVIKNLWTGYNVTYTNDNGETFTGVPVGNNAKTVAKDASSGVYEQVYTIPADATASKNGYTFEGWQFSGSGSLPAGVVPSGTPITGITSDITLKANLVLNQPISFDPVYSGVSGLPYLLKATSTGSTYQILFTPQLANYTFNGWSVTGGKAQIDPTDPNKVIDINAPITLTPKWVPAGGSAPVGSHTVTFDGVYTGVSNIPAVQVVKDGETATAPTQTPLREGYVFKHWSATQNGEAYAFGSALTEDLTLYAVWEREKVYITWPAGLTGVSSTSPSPLPASVDKGSSISFQLKLDNGYEFRQGAVKVDGVPLGWTFDEATNTYHFTFKADTDAKNKTIVVTADNPTVKTFTISLPQGDGYAATFTDCKDAAGTAITAAEGMTSYTFSYGDKFKIKLESDADVAATLRVNGAGAAATNGKDTLTATTGEYTVEGNYLVSASAKRRVERTVIFTLLPEYSQYTQMFVDNGSKITAPTAPDIAGYNFGGKWYKDANCKTEWDFNNDTVTSNTVLYGKLTAKTYTISYNENQPADATDAVAGMPTDTTQKKHGTAVSLDTATPTLTGYTFKGWATSANGPVAYAAGGQYLVDSDITLYAVWQIDTFTVTVSSGAGYSTVPSGTYTVEYGQPFTVTINVDRQYAAVKPTVKDNGTPVEVTGNQNDIGAASYTYTINSVTANHSIDITVTQNEVHTVSFTVSKLTSAPNATILTAEAEAAPFLTQSVEHGYYASMPAAPEREGFKFKGYYLDATGVTAFPFEQPITNNEEVFAVYEPILPVITITELNGTGWKTESWKHGAEGTETPAAITSNAFTIAYGDNVTFDLVIAKGYDYSKLSVTANGLALGYQSATTDEKTGVTTLHYYLGSVMADTRIAITGIERKTITITYNANARDDVSGLPSPQVVKYYLAALGETGNDKITTQEPKRTGYEFVGWCTDSEATVTVNGDAKTINAKTDGVVVYPGATAPFTTDTTLYAIWLAQDTTLTLKITDVALDKNDGKRVIQYEGESITLQAELNVNAKGTVVFYKGDKEGTNGTRIGSAAINGKTAELSVKVGDYKAGGVTEHYWAVFESETDEGYANSEKSNIMNVGVFSKAITWPLDTKNAGTLTITEATGSMTAGKTYKLTVDITKILGLETVTPDNAPKLGEDYAIVWQYKNTVTGDWADMSAEITDTNEYQVTPEYAGHEYRAKIVPIGDLYTKAAKFDENGIVNNEYDKFLYTNTVGSVLQSTATALTITGAETEANNVKINGATLFTADHLAQFEEQTVTLTAKVTKDGTTPKEGVETGKVSFYRLASTDAAGTQTWELISTVDVQTAGENTGVASTTYTMGAYDSTSAGASATTNKETFKAVYVANETYATSETNGNADVYIKSAKLMTPVIESTLAGKLDDTNKTAAQATTYEYNLTELLAGVQHTFKLRQDADQTAKDYSVVALDGRTVEAKNYDIKWLKTTGSNEQEVDATGTNQIKVDENKVDDRYRVKLTGKGVFAGSEATSKDAVIGTKQNVTVTVKALDAIESTAATDVYQLNEITLTATVAAANDKPTMQPTGTVTFYYKDGENWVKLDSTTLADATDGSGSKIASIKTSELPVKAGDNTKQDVEITAVYEGNDTFNASATVNETAKSITAAAGCTTTNDTVTVYSSVVFNCNDENKKQPTDGDKGIHISVSDGAFKANEKATLALSDIYTLDRNLDKALLNTIAKLNPTTDYIVQWQKLNGATAITSGDYGAAKNWTNIDGKTGTTLVLDKVEQNTAYRAVITVNDQPITKGSFDKLDQGVIGTADANDGRQVYYSNVLMPTDTNMTVSVALNTSKIGAENTEGITEGETVTANVFLSGVVGAVPNANVTVKVTNDSAKGNDTAYEKTFTSMNTVNGWNAFSWNTAESDDKGVPTAPGFYTLTVSATTNTGYAAKEITRSLIVRESSYSIAPSNTTVTYNGRTQGLTVTLDGFDFKGTGINEAANKSWTVKYYDKGNNLVEPTQAGTYKAVVTLPGSAYWTEHSETVDFTISKRSVSIADAVAQAKVYDGTDNVNIVEVMLNDAVTDQTTNGTGLPTNNVGIINGDSIYAVATAAALSSANAGDNSFTISTIELRGDDAANYVWNNDKYTENIYVSRSQVYGEHGTLELKQGETFPADKVIKMIDQSGREITLGTGTEDYTLTFYYHSDTKIEKTTDISKLGLYTVVARPNQSNYKSGVTMQFTVVETATNLTEAATPKPSTLIYLSDTATKYNPAGNVPVTAKNAQGNTVKVEYHGTTWSETVPSYAGRYLVKATDTSTGDVAYGIYTITKAHPSIDVTPATGLTYNSMPQNGYTTLTGVEGKDASKDYYITYAGDVAIGYNTPADGNVDEQVPVDAGTYTVTLHVSETANYTAHEISKSFTIAKKALTIKADSWQTTQYDAFPDMTAKYEGLAAVDTDTTPDTSLRDVQIAPEFLYNPTGGKSNYSNDSLDQVGGVAIQPIDALSKNYAITYENGQYTKQRTETNVDFAIHGLPQSSTGKNTVYYGDEIQLYPYGYYTTHANGSGIFNWSVSAGAPATIDADKGILKVTGVGEFIVTLTRGEGELQISTSVTVTAIQKEAKIALKNVDKVYNGALQTYAYEGNVTVHDELYQPIGNFVDSKLTRTNTARTDVGTQITTAKVTGAWAYQSETYGGKFTINDKDATVAPVADAHIYGTTRTIPSPAYTSTDSNAISNVLTASQTDAYNRLDVHDGYEILVAGAENMNYNIKYTTDHNDTAKNAEDSAVTTYQDVVFTSKTDKYLNDATIYGETPNVLDWTLVNVIGTTRDSVDYADNLADFNLPDTFVWQDKDDCTGNKVTYKAANRTTDAADSSNIRYNQDKLEGPRTSTDTNTDENYTLKFNTVKNSGAANYKLTNDKAGNSATTTNALTANSKGFITPATGESSDVSSENFVEGSANIAQRPIKLEKAVDDVQLYWKLSQKQLYTALVNVLKAEENSVGRGLAKGHTIEDLDLSFTIGSTPVDKNNDQPMTGLTVGTQTVTVTVGDTNYKLEGSNTFEVDFQTMRIRATYYNKTFTGFDVRIEKIDAAGNWVGPLDSTKGLTFKVLKQTNGVLDTETDYAANKSFTFVSKDGTYGYFHGSYSQLPLLGNGELYVFQMYEYGVPLERK